jgi:predicted membrane protein (TIGR00267 family)
VGAYLTECAERQREFSELEQVTLIDMSEAKIGRASRLAVIIVSLVDGFSPFAAALLTLIPLLFSPLFDNIPINYLLSLGVALFLLFGLGMWLGHNSKRSLVGYGLRTLVADFCQSD